MARPRKSLAEALTAALDSQMYGRSTDVSLRDICAALRAIGFDPYLPVSRYLPTTDHDT